MINYFKFLRWVSLIGLKLDLSLLCWLLVIDSSCLLLVTDLTFLILLEPGQYSQQTMSDSFELIIVNINH
jgi:hypothetical protein